MLKITGFVILTLYCSNYDSIVVKITNIVNLTIVLDSHSDLNKSIVQDWSFPPVLS